MKFALYMMGEYCHIIIASALIATLYFGGYDLVPFAHLIPGGPFDQRFILEHLGGVIAVVAAVTGLLLLGFSWLVGLRAKRYAGLKASDIKVWDGQR